MRILHTQKWTGLKKLLIQLSKGLPCKHKEPEFDPQNPKNRKLGVAVCIYHPGLGKVETGRSLGFIAKSAEPTQS